MTPDRSTKGPESDIPTTSFKTHAALAIILHNNATGESAGHIASNWRTVFQTLKALLEKA